MNHKNILERMEESTLWGKKVEVDKKLAQDQANMNPLIK
jgi:hypothetical protein